MDPEDEHRVGSADEAAVRGYLLMLHDRSWLTAVPEYERLRQERDQAADPLERVRLDGQLRQLERALADRCEAAFVACAKQWAEAHGVTAEAFRVEGVPADVLRRAGFPLREDRARSRPASQGGRASPTTSDIRAAMPPGRFTVDDIEQRTGASRGAVRRAIRLMLQRGEVEQVRPADDSTRARVYRRVR